MSTTLDSFVEPKSSDRNIGDPVEVLRVPIEDKSGSYDVSVRILQEFGDKVAYLDTAKVKQLWERASEHETLFSDHTKGKIEPFLELLFSPRAVWFELFRLDRGTPFGVMYITNVIPFFDAEGHVALWDRIARGREPVVREVARLLMGQYNLQRISASIPVYQSGTLRFIKRVGFVEEGMKRDAVIHKGRWFPMAMLGLTREDLEAVAPCKN